MAKEEKNLFYMQIMMEFFVWNLYYWKIARVSFIKKPFQEQFAH